MYQISQKSTSQDKRCLEFVFPACLWKRRSAWKQKIAETSWHNARQTSCSWISRPNVNWQSPEVNITNISQITISAASPCKRVSDDEDDSSARHLHDRFHLGVGKCRGNLSRLFFGAGFWGFAGQKVLPGRLLTEFSPWSESIVFTFVNPKILS